MEKKLAVIALGGNALLRGNQKGTIEEQNANTVDTLENLVYLIKDGYNLIISHGNGPQRCRGGDVWQRGNAAGYLRGFHARADRVHDRA